MLILQLGSRMQIERLVEFILSAEPYRGAIQNAQIVHVCDACQAGCWRRSARHATSSKLALGLL